MKTSIYRISLVFLFGVQTIGFSQNDELNYVVETFKTWFEQEQKDVL